VESNVRTTLDADGVMTLWLDRAHRSVNTMSPEMMAELAAVLAGVAESPAQRRPAGVICASAKPLSFFAGADIYELRKMSAQQVDEYLACGQRLCQSIADLKMPTVAAINGDCLGGGFELALACTYRVCCDSGRIAIGLPELKLGLIPGWGGTVRLPPLVGLRVALPMILNSKTLPPRKALELGVIDEVVPRDSLVETAKRLLLTRPPPHRPAQNERELMADASARGRFIDSARNQINAQTFGQYPAVNKAAEVIDAGLSNGGAAGLDAERRGLVSLFEGEPCRSMIRLFCLQHDARHKALDNLHVQPAPVQQAIVIGAGSMGAGIAHALARAGVRVRFVDVNEDALAAGVAIIRALFNEDRSAGRLTESERDEAFTRIVSSTTQTDAEQIDFAIESVSENLEVKREVLRTLDRSVNPTAVLASNTSALAIASLAAATQRPANVIGMHFFNPVQKMPLVEVVITPATHEQALATTIGLAGRLGKTIVISRDSPGFIVNRILMPYFSEAMRMVAGGASVLSIDLAMKKWGMPMGALELLDHVGLDVVAAELETLGHHFPGDRFVPRLLDVALERRWLGRKNGCGFYRGDPQKDAGGPTINAELVEVLRSTRRDTDDQGAEDSMQWRLILLMINEAARLLAEGVAQSPEAIDLATTLGLGLAPFRGGLAHFAEREGIAAITRRLEDLARRLGPRFVPAESLQLLESGRST
jgi:3-hydroxyacyl-CoA dehydrogenase/enoyl-CoA hydratase/3-hydroxybutyryl-CoA epimerase